MTQSMEQPVHDSNHRPTSGIDSRPLFFAERLTLATMRYDGAGRRISCAVQNQGDLDVTYHAYYDGQSEIESRNGSDQVLRQYVWGSSGGAGQYIDELCQVALNQDPWNADAGSPTENDVERFFYALHDANHNVIGITTHAGRLIERYEYTPYGQRQVYTHGWLMSDLNGDGVVDAADESIVSAGTDPAADLDGDGDIDSADLALVQADLGQALPASDPLVTHPAAMSFRGDLAQTAGVALCPVGHQGLIHDEELGTSGGGSLIYNRARHLHPRLGRFMQREPLGYIDGMSLYQYVRSRLHYFVDPSGLQVVEVQSVWAGEESLSRGRETKAEQDSEGWGQKFYDFLLEGGGAVKDVGKGLAEGKSADDVLQSLGLGPDAILDQAAKELEQAIDAAATRLTVCQALRNMDANHDLPRAHTFHAFLKDWQLHVQAVEHRSRCVFIVHAVRPSAGPVIWRPNCDAPLRFPCDKCRRVDMVSLGGKYD